MTTYTNYKIGTTSGSMIDLGVEVGASVRAPKSDPVKYSQYIPLADGSVRGLGWQYTEWKFAVLTAAERDILRAFCSGASASVYIVTRTQENSDEFKLYQASMIWPQEERRDFLRRPDFTLKFNKMVEVT